MSISTSGVQRRHLRHTAAMATPVMIVIHNAPPELLNAATKVVNPGVREATMACSTGSSNWVMPCPEVTDS